MLYSYVLTAAALAGSAVSEILWDGRFNDLTSSSEIAEWSWSNEVGPYQYYIHGSENITSYVNLDSTFKNPADTGSTQGVKITLDDTSYWNGQTMRRTELIPQTTAAINSGTVYYHFSIMRSDTNAPSKFREHQIAFFESHFTELKSGVSTTGASSDPLLRWDVSSTSQWSTNWTAGVWHNCAYEIDFDGGSVAFYHSTGSDDLALAVAAVSVSASSDGADWHLGVLELPVTGQTDATEDFYFSGVYIESGSLTTSISGPDGSSVVSSSAGASSATSSTASSQISSTSAVQALASSSSAIASVSTATVIPVEVSTSALSSSSSAISTFATVVTIPTTSGGVSVPTTSSEAIAASSAVDAASVSSSSSIVNTTSAAQASSSSTKKKCSSVTPTATSASASAIAQATSATASASASKTKKKCSSVTPTASGSAATQTSSTAKTTATSVGIQVGAHSVSTTSTGSATVVTSTASATSTSSVSAVSMPSGTTLDSLLSWLSSFYSSHKDTEYTGSTVARRHARDVVKN